jgi:hypothetical protein
MFLMGNGKLSANCGKENYVIKDINTEQIFSAPHGQSSAHTKCTPTATQHSEPPEQFRIYECFSGLTREVQRILKATENQECL